jgi:hypothetical protein
MEGTRLSAKCIYSILGVIIAVTIFISKKHTTTYTNVLIKKGNEPRSEWIN